MVAWNCNGKLNSAIDTVIKKFTSASHIIHLSETKHNNYTKFETPINYVTLSRPGTRLGDVDRGGNIIFLKKYLYKYLKKTAYFEWGIVLYFNDVTLLFVYIVPDDSRYHRDVSFTELHNVLSNIEKNGKIGISVGDHNGRMGKLVFRNNVYEDNIDATRNRQGEILSLIYNENAFYPMNHLLSDKRHFPGCYTFVKGERKSQIDFLFTNNHGRITQFVFDDSVLNQSDHVALIFTMKMKMSLPSTSLLKWSRDSRKIGHTENIKMFKINFDIDTEKLKLVLQPKLTNYVNNLLSGEANMKTAVTELNRTLEKSFVECKLWRSEKKECGDWNRLDGKELWDRIDWSGNLSGTKNHEKPEDEETFKYFKNLYAPENEPVVDDIIVEQHIYMPVTDDPISTSEVSEAFNQQKSRNNFGNRHLRPIKDLILYPVFLLFNFIFFATTTLIDWVPSVLFTIPKKGNLKLIKNWRGIQMNEFLNAWYDRILGNRIKRWMNVDEFQTAYQKGKGCNTQIFTLRTITESAKMHNTPIFISYIDLEKAFDRV